MKAQFNQMLEFQKHRVQTLEAQVSTSKLTYADALRNLEQISDEIHRSRSTTHGLLHKNNAGMQNLKPSSNDSSTSISEDLSDTSDEFKCLPSKLNFIAASSEEVNDCQSADVPSKQEETSLLFSCEKLLCRGDFKWFITFAHNTMFAKV